MIYPQNAKTVALEPQSVTAGSTTTLLIDRKGFDYISLDVLLGRVSNASNVPFVINISESDDTNASNFAVISGTSATGNITALPTSGVTIASWDITGIGRKRYLQLNFSPQATEVVSALASLDRAEQAIITTTQKNVASWIIL